MDRSKYLIRTKIFRFIMDRDIALRPEDRDDEINNVLSVYQKYRVAWANERLLCANIVSLNPSYIAHIGISDDFKRDLFKKLKAIDLSYLCCPSTENWVYVDVAVEIWYNRSLSHEALKGVLNGLH